MNIIYLKFQFAYDSWLSNDKGFHCFGSSYLYLLICAINLPFPILITSLLGLFWEIKDGFLPSSKYGFIGGDGFSYKDFIADLTGIFLAIILGLI